MNFIKKPFVALVVVVFIVASIIFIQSKKVNPDKTNVNTDEEKETKYPKAPDFFGIDKWINSEPLKIEQLRGKVVLVDFWTYTCINCIRTLPYLKSWDAKYRDKGLVIVGVHTPEFEFEKKYENVLKAVNDYKIKYPVAQDNNYATWSAYQNRYWPHEFLIDIDGYIRHDHIGEGSYDKTESMIQELLKDKMEREHKNSSVQLQIQKPGDAVDFEYKKIGTPEIYFGYQFSRGSLGYQESKPDEIFGYEFPQHASKNYVYLSGKWKNNADNLELAGHDGSILLIFEAKKINIVAGSDNESTAYIFLDNDKLNDKTKGLDTIFANNSSITKIKEFKLYNLASAADYDTHAVNINVQGKGFKIYTFTFG